MTGRFATGLFVSAYAKYYILHTKSYILPTMYPIHTTPAFILRSIDTGESARRYALFTRDFGLLWASARGVRDIKSKLRFHLHDGAQVSISLVRGRESWRLTNAYAGRALSALADTTRQRTYLRVLLLVERLVRGEERSDALYQLLTDFSHQIVHAASVEEVHDCECITVLHLLAELGYARIRAPYAELARKPLFSVENSVQARTYRRAIIAEINRALRASNL